MDQSILLCLLARKHLIFRTNNTQSVAKHAANVLSNLDYTTLRLKIRHKQDALSFLSALFLRPSRHHPQRYFANDDHELPRAIVVSGLELAGIPAQRALVRVLDENRVTLPDSDRLWILPDGFILVYVCPFDPREMPPIHKSLIDRFAMSTTISLPHPHHSPQSSPLSSAPASPPLPTHSLPPAFLPALRTAYASTHLPPTLALYTSDLFSAARHHNELDGTLLTLRARRDADCLIRAARVLGLGGDAANTTGNRTRHGIADDRDDSHVITRTSGIAEVAGDNDNDNDDYERFIRPGPPPPPPAIHTLAEPDRGGLLDISEADVARIVPRVISHRLRVLDSPADEVLASAMFGAVGNSINTNTNTNWERRTVKDILVQILSEV